MQEVHQSVTLGLADAEQTAQIGLTHTARHHLVPEHDLRHGHGRQAHHLLTRFRRRRGRDHATLVDVDRQGGFDGVHGLRQGVGLVVPEAVQLGQVAAEHCQPWNGVALEVDCIVVHGHSSTGDRSASDVVKGLIRAPVA
ncbi:hypothetical protein FQZ97_1114370 [compost metagenome]